MLRLFLIKKELFRNSLYANLSWHVNLILHIVRFGILCTFFILILILLFLPFFFFLLINFLHHIVAFLVLKFLLEYLCILHIYPFIFSYFFFVNSFYFFFTAFFNYSDLFFNKFISSIFIYKINIFFCLFVFFFFF